MDKMIVGMRKMKGIVLKTAVLQTISNVKLPSIAFPSCGFVMRIQTAQMHQMRPTAIKKLADLMNSSVKTTTVFPITGGVIAKMTAVIIQMKKTVSHRPVH